MFLLLYFMFESARYQFVAGDKFIAVMLIRDKRFDPLNKQSFIDYCLIDK